MCRKIQYLRHFTMILSNIVAKLYLQNFSCFAKFTHILNAMLRFLKGKTLQTILKQHKRDTNA